MATWVSCPQACMAPSTSLAKSSPVCSGIGSASMSPRSRIVGPGRPPVSRAAMPLVDSCRVTSRSRSSRSSRMRSRVMRQVVADLGPAVEVPPELDGAVQQVPGLLLERVVGHGAW